MGLKSRRKGRRGEQEAVRLLLTVFPTARSKVSGGESATVDRGRDILGTPGLCVQVQLRARPAIERKLTEACVAAKGTEDVPVALTRRDRGEWLATLRAGDFVALLDKAQRQAREAKP